MMLTAFTWLLRPPVQSFFLSGPRGTGKTPWLRRSDANLLAGRANNRQCFPLIAAEIGRHPQVDEILRHGLLPRIRMEPDLAVDFPDAYVANHIRGEIQQEALVNGQVVNGA